MPRQNLNKPITKPSNAKPVAKQSIAKPLVKQPVAKQSKQSNEKVVDYLSEDDEVPNQRFVCVSFASVTEVMKDDIYNEIADQLKKPVDEVKEIVSEWCKREHPMRGFKVRGVAKDIEQINKRAQVLRQANSNFHIFTCEMGKWLPYDPNPELLENEEFMEQQLNDLLKGYKTNRVNTKQHYDERKRELMEKAIAEGTPSGQQTLVNREEPIEAVKYKATQAEESIQQLQDRIKELERTREEARKQLDLRKDEFQRNELKINELQGNELQRNEFQRNENEGVSMSEFLGNEFQRNEFLGNEMVPVEDAKDVPVQIGQMRQIQDESRKAQFTEVAVALASQQYSGLFEAKPQIPSLLSTQLNEGKEEGKGKEEANE